MAAPLPTTEELIGLTRQWMIQPDQAQKAARFAELQRLTRIRARAFAFDNPYNPMSEADLDSNVATRIEGYVKAVNELMGQDRELNEARANAIGRYEGGGDARRIAAERSIANYNRRAARIRATRRAEARRAAAVAAAAEAAAAPVAAAPVAAEPSAKRTRVAGPGDRVNNNAREAWNALNNVPDRNNRRSSRKRESRRTRRTRRVRR